MSYVFAGYPIETKPASPRQDVVAGTDGAIPKEFAYYFKMYDTIQDFGIISIALCIGDNVNTALEQSIHGTCTQLQELLLENKDFITHLPTERQGFVVSLPVGQVKSQAVVVNVANATILETDLDQDGINVAFYVQAQNADPVSIAGYHTAFTRIIELAREKRYICTPELKRNAPPVADNEDPSIGNTVTITPPTWTGGTADWAYWVLNGVAVQPLQDGLSNLVLDDIQLEESGFYQVKAGVRVAPDKVPDQYRTSIGVQITVT